MLQLESMYLYGKTEEALDTALEKYNAAHPDARLSYQDYCKMLLDEAIRRAAQS